MIGGFVSFHPLVAALYFIGLVASIMWLSHPLYLSAACGGILLFHLLLDRGEGLRKAWKGYVLMASLVMLMNPLFSGRGATILAYLGHRPVTLESVAYGMVFALLLVTMLIAFQAGQKVITDDKFIYLTGRMLPRTAYVIVMIERLIPLLHRRLHEINAVAKAQGRFRGNSRIKKMREAMESLNVLMVWTLEESLHMAVSMRASGYGSGPRSSFVYYRMQKRDYRMLAFMCALALAIASGGIQGLGRIGFYPTLYWQPLNALHYISYLLWCLIPILINLGESIQWKLINLKM